MFGRLGLPGGSVVKNLPASAGDVDLIPGSGRSPREGNGFSHSSILAWRIPLDREAWQATVFGFAKSWTGLKRLGTHTHTYSVTPGTESGNWGCGC